MGGKHGALQTGGVVERCASRRWCIGNVELVKVDECELMRASGEGCRPETNLMGKIAAECKMMGLLRVQKCAKHTKECQPMQPLKCRKNFLWTNIGD